MTAKEYLQQAYKMDRRIRIIEAKVEKLRASLEYSPPSFIGAGSGSSADRMPDMISLIVEYEQQAEKLREEYIARYREIDRAIAAVPDDLLRELLERRYLLNQRWEQIAAEMHYSERRIYQLHGNALQMISLNFSNNL